METAETAETTGTAETAETATEPKTVPPAVFKNGREVKTDEMVSDLRTATP